MVLNLSLWETQLFFKGVEEHCVLWPLFLPSWHACKKSTPQNKFQDSINYNWLYSKIICHEPKIKWVKERWGSRHACIQVVREPKSTPRKPVVPRNQEPTELFFDWSVQGSEFVLFFIAWFSYLTNLIFVCYFSYFALFKGGINAYKTYIKTGNLIKIYTSGVTNCIKKACA